MFRYVSSQIYEPKVEHTLGGTQSAFSTCRAAQFMMTKPFDFTHHLNFDLFEPLHCNACGSFKKEIISSILAWVSTDDWLLLPNASRQNSSNSTLFLVASICL